MAYLKAIFIVNFIPDSVLEVNIKVGDSLSMINGIKK